MQPIEWTKKQYEKGALRWSEVVELVKFYQSKSGLTPDGKPGNNTLSHLRKTFPHLDPLKIDFGWVSGNGVERIEIHDSWVSAGHRLPGSIKGIVAHYTATDPGTGASMARRRQRPLGEKDRKASWHVTIEANGEIIQMASFHRRAWHARRTPQSEKLVGGSPNDLTIGIELVGKGKFFPPEQVSAAKRVWRSIVQSYGIRREMAMIEHSKLDPRRRADPGERWMDWHAPDVLDFAYS